MMASGMGWHDSAPAFERHVRGLHERCQGAYHAFDTLPRLVDQLRILSVNAELASARAGDHGRAVRVLTHFATESVTRLLAVVPRMVELKKLTYGFAGTVMRAAADVLKIEAAGSRVLAAGHSVPAGAEDPMVALGRARSARLGALAAAAAGLSRTHQQLLDAVRSVREVTIQVEIITANIAIEATSAGPHERDLQAVADTMKGPVDQLRAMIDEAQRLLREAAETNLALATLGTK
ncbi:MAG: chemotaxis protein [Pseudomonadota bacterium]